MNIRQLRYFIGVLEAGNMTRAASRLHVAQTALGMQIRLLEEDVGVDLLVRHSRGVSPTPAGTLLHVRALEILSLVEHTRREVAEAGGEQTEPIRFGTTPALMPIVGPEIALVVRKDLPKVSLSMVEAMSHILFAQLVGGEIDFMLGYDVPEQAGVSRTALLQDELVLVTPPGATRGEPITFASALKEVLAMPEPGDTVRAVVVRQAEDLGIELKVTYEVRSVSAMKNLVGRGVACSVLPYFAVADEVRDGRLNARPIMQPAIRRTLFLAYSSHRLRFRNEAGLTVAVRASIKGLLDVLGPLGHPV